MLKRLSIRSVGVAAALALLVYGGLAMWRAGAEPAAEPQEHCRPDLYVVMTRVPHYPGTKIAPRHSSYGAAVSCSAEFGTPDSEVRVQAHYRRTLRSLGWAVTSHPGDDLVAERERFSIAIATEADDRVTRVYVDVSQPAGPG